MTKHSSASTNHKILVVGNNTVIRRGIVDFLRTLDYSFGAGEASFESVISDLSGDFDWDLIALDLEGGGQLSILERIKEVRPSVPILVLNSDHTPTDVKAAVTAGASGYLGKSSSIQAWRNAFEIVAAGGRYPDSEPTG